MQGVNRTQHFSVGSYPKILPSSIANQLSSNNEEFLRAEKDFSLSFGHLAERLRASFTCDCQSEKDSSSKGRVFITDVFLAFHSPNTQKIIPFAEISDLSKKNKVFGQAINVVHTHGRETLSSFGSRDTAYEYIMKKWKEKKSQKESKIKNQIKQEPKAQKPTPVRAPSESLFKIDENISLVPREEPESQSTPNVSIHSADSISRKRKRVRSSLLKNSTGILLEDGIPIANQEKEKEKEKKVSKSLEESKMVPPKQEIQGDIKVAPKKGESEVKIEAPNEEIKRPVGFYQHLSIKAPPVVRSTFKDISITDFYDKLIDDASFWVHMCQVQENKNITVPPLLPSTTQPKEMFERKLEFLSPIKGAPMGPKETRVIQTQHISMPTSTTIILDASTKSLDIPMYGDSFLVESLWTIKQEKADCLLEIQWKVNFIKSVWVKGLIEKNAKTQTEASLRGWVDLAHKRLSKPIDENENHGIPLHIEEILEESEGLEGYEEEISFFSDLVDIPFLREPVQVKWISLFVGISVFFCCSLFLLWHVQNLENELFVWQSASCGYRERLFLLQWVASNLARDIGEKEDALETEWEYWKLTKGLDWRLAQWQEHIISLQAQLSSSLQEVSDILHKVSSHGDQSEKLFNEKDLRALLRSIDTSQPILQEIGGGWFW